jgi:hypothetical protein
LQPNTLPEVRNTDREKDVATTFKEDQGCLNTKEDLHSASRILKDDIEQVDLEQIDVVKKQSTSFVKQFRYLTK